jgi:hypothetical protein
MQVYQRMPTDRAGACPDVAPRPAEAVFSKNY